MHCNLYDHHIPWQRVFLEQLVAVMRLTGAVQRSSACSYLLSDFLL